MIDRWLAPWHPVQQEDERTGLLDELRRELGASHPLHCLSATVVGRRHDTDDVVFSLADDRMAVVHLAWAGREMRSDSPWTDIYADAQVFVQQRMILDHLAFGRPGSL